MIIIFIS